MGNTVTKAFIVAGGVCIMMIGVGIGVASVTTAFHTAAAVKAAGPLCLMTWAEIGSAGAGAVTTGSLAYISCKTVEKGVEIIERPK